MEKDEHKRELPVIRPGGTVTVEEIARILCERSYCELRGQPEKSGSLYPPEKYWEVNKDYFLREAKTYLEVRECMDE